MSEFEKPEEIPVVHELEEDQATAEAEGSPTETVTAEMPPAEEAIISERDFIDVQREVERYRPWQERNDRALTFGDLYLVLDDIEKEGAKIPDSDRFYTAEEVREQLNEFQMSEALDPRIVASGIGFRSTAVRLMEEGAGIKRALSPQQLKVGIMWARRWQGKPEDQRAIWMVIESAIKNKMITRILKEKVPTVYDIREAAIRLVLQQATSFDELYGLLTELGDFETDTQSYTPKELIEKISGLRERWERGDEIDPRVIPRRFNLRELVLKLLQQERK